VTTREAFLAGVRREMANARAAGRPSPSPRPADARAAAARPAGVGGQTEALLARFRAEAERVGTRVHRAPTVEAAGELVLGLARAGDIRRVGTWSRAQLGRAAEVAAGLARAGLEVVDGSPEPPTEPDPPAFARMLAAVEMGLTGVDLAVAETGSLVLRSGPGRGRSVSLLPGCHVAVFGPAQLVPTLADAGLALEAWHTEEGGGANIVFITGPSRTADIELTLTRGVHGPREVHAVFVDAL
jgi:L-lactate dehydrogenase complex protein LldG